MPVSADKAVEIIDPAVLYIQWPTYIPSDYNVRHVHPDNCYICSSTCKEKFKSKKFKKPPGYNNFSLQAKYEYNQSQQAKQFDKFKSMRCACCAITENNQDDYAFEALKKFNGRMVIVVGESGGCTGSDRLTCLLDKLWTRETELMHPGWSGVYSSIQIYKKK